MARGNDGLTVLMAAAGSGSFTMCRLLLEFGANTNEYDCFGMTALMYAIHF
jgi:ankyrin repeat protein